jgi:hypothetical protein
MIKLCSRCGCYAQLKPEELAAVDGVDLVLELQKI